MSDSKQPSAAFTPLSETDSAFLDTQDSISGLSLTGKEVKYPPTRRFGKDFRHDLASLVHHLWCREHTLMERNFGLPTGDGKKIYNAVDGIYECDREDEIPAYISKHQTDDDKLFLTRSEILALKSTQPEGSYLNGVLQTMDDVLYSHKSNNPIADPTPPAISVTSTLTNSQLAFVLSNTARQFERATQSYQESSQSWDTREYLRELLDSGLGESLSKAKSDNEEVFTKDLSESVANLSRFVRNFVAILSGGQAQYDAEDDIALIYGHIYTLPDVCACWDERVI